MKFSFSNKNSVRMSFWNPGTKNEEDLSQLMHIFPKKGYKKIGPLTKLQIINALDNGQCKMEIAKKYGVNPQTISNMYRKKEYILHKYTQTYSTLVQDVRSVDLDKVLFEWFKSETQNGNTINEEQLQSKATNLVRTLNKISSTCTKDWLLDFRLRHNIIAYKSYIKCSLSAKEEWLNFLHKKNMDDLYIGAVCSLTYKYDLKKYVNGENIDNFACVFLVTNATGNDKKQLVIVGQEILDVNVCSLPIIYYNGAQPQMNQFVLSNYLKKWDIELKAENKSIFLLLNVPNNFIPYLGCENIRILNITHYIYVLKASEKIIECFKFHYRKNLINKTILQNYEPDQLTVVDYIHLMSLAWYYVSNRYIRLLFSPLDDGSLLFNIESGDDGDHSITKWFKENNINLDVNLTPSALDKYILCDAKIPCFNLNQSDKYALNTREIILDKNMQSTSVMEAYQAMRRLLSYIQGEGAGDTLIQKAKQLEDQLEYGTLMELHQIAADSINE